MKDGIKNSVYNQYILNYNEAYMKRFFKTFLFLILLGTSIYSQTADPFFFGMYAPTGIGYSMPGVSDPYLIRHFKANNSDFMTFWKDSLKFNSTITNICPGLLSHQGDLHNHIYQYDCYLKYFKEKNPSPDVTSDYGINGEIENKKFFPIYEDAYTSGLAEGQYIKLDLNTSDKILFNAVDFTIAADEGGYRVTNYSGEDKTNVIIIKNIQVIGSYFGLNIIKPRKPIITNGKAKFTIRFKIDAETTTDLYVSVINDPLSPRYQSSTYNSKPLNNVHLNVNGYNQSYELPFYLDVAEEHTAYNFAFKLEVKGTLSDLQSIIFKEIAIYDDIGKGVVEDGNYKLGLDDSTELASLTAELVQTTGLPIVRLADEPTIANFIPSKIVKEKMNSIAGPAKKIYYYGTQPDGSAYWNSDPEDYKSAARNIITRFYETVGLDYVGFDNYPFGSPDNSTGSDYIWNLYGEFFTTLKNFKNDINNPSKKLIAIPQIHSWSNLRNPTKSEIVSCSYISMLLGYKGIIYFYSGLSDESGKDGLYKCGSQIASVGTGAYVASLNNSERVFQGKKSAIKKVAAFLNETVDIDNPAQKVGDLLAAASPNINEENNRILGRNADNTYDTDGIDEVINLGNETDFTLLERVAVVDPSTGALLTNQKNLFGVNWFTYNGKSYFLFANLNEDGHAFKLKLYFKSHKANLLKINTAPYSVFGKITYPASGAAFLTIPADGAVLMQVENTNSGWHGFPRNETRFGIARTTNNITSLYLDKNYYTKAGVPEEVSINTGINTEVISLHNKDANGIIYTDLFALRMIDPNINSLQMKMEFIVFRQDSNGAFTRQSNIYYVRKPFTIADPSTFKVGPIAYDANGDGIDELCYYVAYNNQYHIYAYNQAAPIKKYPSALISPAPDYYSITSANIFGMRRLINGIWKSSLCVYKDGYFYMDMNADNVLNVNDTNEKFYMWSANHIPIIGDWANNDMHTSLPSEAFEYGLYGWDGFYGNSFQLNFGHNDGYGYFAFPYGDPGDKPIVWIPRNLYPNPFNKSTDEAIDESAEIPSEYSISQNFPNPFNPATTIRFALPAESRVTLDVFNILGERVAELVNDVRPAGTMDVRFDGSNLASGIYIYKFNATSLENGKHFQKINKMMLLK